MSGASVRLEPVSLFLKAGAGPESFCGPHSSDRCSSLGDVLWLANAYCLEDDPHQCRVPRTSGDPTDSPRKHPGAARGRQKAYRLEKLERHSRG